MEAGMDFTLNQEQQLWRRTVHDFCQAEIRPKAAEADAEARLAPGLIPKLGRLGLLGMAIPEVHGGAGVDALGTALALEELGWACGGTALSVAAHNGLCAAAISSFGSDAQKARWLPDLASGERGLGALALTEPGAGSDLTGGITTRAERQGDDWVISGQKAWITNAGLAPVIVCLCRTDPKGGHRSLGLILVPADAPGVHVHPAEKKFGMRASPTNAISLEGVRVPADHLLGESGEGLHQTLQVLDGGRIGIAAIGLGLAGAALEQATAYARERRTFGRPIAEHQAIQFMLADAATQIEASRWLLYYAASLKDRGQPYTLQAAMAKLQASETAESVCRTAIQVLGSYGYSQEYPVERYYRDARLLTIGEGTSEVQRMVIAKRLLRLS
jgi:alkylation response protein AidB-like acyl-CoA dehydrogenase